MKILQVELSTSRVKGKLKSSKQNLKHAKIHVESSIATRKHLLSIRLTLHTFVSLTNPERLYLKVGEL